jgi:prepilin-type N-terminal cleavage/methylation domain-containing protein
MNRPGMTLVEVLVGLSVAGLAISAGYGALGFLTDRTTQLRDASHEIARAAAVRRSLVQWTAGARLVADGTGAPFQGIDGRHDDLEDDMVSFYTTSSTPLEADGSIVRFFMDRDDDTPEQGLVAEFLDPATRHMQRIEIEPGITGLELRFLSGIAGDDRWLPSWVSTSVLPRGIEFTLHSSDPDLPDQLVAHPLRIQIGAGR